jgi:hypothetical protein
MTIYKFPDLSGKFYEQKREKKAKNHHPEFIDIEDLQEDGIDSEPYVHLYEGVERLESFQMPFLIRLFAFAVSISLFGASLLMFVLAGLAGVLTLITFTKNQFILSRFLAYWKYAKRIFVLGLGLLIMCFSPALGMGFSALYFALEGESLEGSMFGNLFKL